MSEDTHYDLLAVHPDASAEEIRDAYRRLSKGVHPDVGGSPMLFRKVQEAYDVLSDPARRRVSDSSLRDGGTYEQDGSVASSNAGWVRTDKPPSKRPPKPPPRTRPNNDPKPPPPKPPRDDPRDRPPSRPPPSAPWSTPPWSPPPPPPARPSSRPGHAPPGPRKLASPLSSSRKPSSPQTLVALHPWVLLIAIGLFLGVVSPWIGTPLVACGVVAAIGAGPARRRRYDESLAASGIDLMDRQRFVDYVEVLLRRQGYSVGELQGDNTPGADLLIEKEGRWSVVGVQPGLGPVQIEQVEQLNSARFFYSSSSAMLFTNGEVDPKVRLLAQQNAIQLFDRELLGRAIDEVAPMPYSGVPLLGEQIRLGASSIARRARAAFNGPPVANKSDIDRHRPDRSGPSETE